MLPETFLLLLLPVDTSLWCNYLNEKLLKSMFTVIVDHVITRDYYFASSRYFTVVYLLEIKLSEIEIYRNR
jgi:hypothetical protein